MIINLIHTGYRFINESFSSNVYSYQHWNGEQAEKALFPLQLRPDTDHEMCIFAKFTQSLITLLNLVPAALIPLIRSTLYSSVSCCCVPLASLFDALDYRNFSIMPWIFAKCEQPKCPRCTAKDTKIWNTFENYRLDLFPESAQSEKEHYYHTLLHLTNVLPLAACKALLDIILMPHLTGCIDELNKGNDKG